jgi:hypothetical protein
MIVVLALVLSIVQAGAEELPPPPPPPDLDVLLAEPPAPAAPAPAPSAAAPAPRPAAPAGLPRLGLALDVGVPEGLALGATFRALPSLRLWAGPAWNYAGFGLQGGLSFTPLPWRLAPALSVEAGRYFSSDLSWLAEDEGGVPETLRPLLGDVSYSYAAAHLGVELGSPRGLVFSLRAGLAYLRAEARGTTSTTSDAGTTVTFRDPVVRGTIPSLKLGLHYWF